MSMAIKYAMKKKMAKGGEVECMACKDGTCTTHDTPDKPAPVSGGYAKGGLVDRIMDKRGAKPMADSESADYDYMDQREPGTEADATGANSGDEAGNDEMDENDRDLIGRIMRSRAKKDKLPRPA